MNDNLKEEAINVFSELFKESAKQLGLENYNIPSDAVENLRSVINSNDEKKLKNYILHTREYINSIKID